MTGEGEGVSQEPTESAAPSSARELDVLFRATDKLYYEFARGCGLSDCAYWILYAMAVEGGSLSQSEIADRLSYSRQTVNSALNTLESRGLVGRAFEEGSRKSKRVSLTPRGREFCDERIAPAIEAEDRAFTSLDAQSRRELLRLVATYTRAIERELGKVRGEGR